MDFILNDNDNPNKKTPLIIISGFMSTEYAEKIKTKNQHIFETLIKPFTTDEIIMSIKRVSIELLTDINLCDDEDIDLNIPDKFN